MKVCGKKIWKTDKLLYTKKNNDDERSVTEIP